MKAWELTRDLLCDTKPVVRTAEEQTWDASAVMKAQDDLMAMFWKSNVPGSAAPVPSEAQLQRFRLERDRRGRART